MKTQISEPNAISTAFSSQDTDQGDNHGVNDRLKKARRVRTIPRGRPDVCAYLLEVCEQCRSEFLDERGISCYFDVDSGALSARRCDILGRIVRTLIREICKERPDNASGGRITVALHHKEDVWILAVTDAAAHALDSEVPPHRGSMIEDLAFRLKGTWRSELTSDGAVTAVKFSTSPGGLTPQEPQDLTPLSQTHLQIGSTP